MKLYATVTSERASKGQGGNEYIDIDLFNNEQEFIGRLVFMEDAQNPGDYVLVEDVTYRHFTLRMDVQNGKPDGKTKLSRQVTGQDFFSIGVAEAERRKGEKQKDDCDIDDTTEHLCKGVGCKA